MAKKSVMFDYDFEADSLFFHKKDSKTKCSVQVGDIVLDFGSKNEVVGSEILNASKTLNTSKDVLTEIKSVSYSSSKKGNALIVGVKIASILGAPLSCVFNIPERMAETQLAECC